MDLAGAHSLVAAVHRIAAVSEGGDVEGRIGHAFRDKGLLKRALTHTSAATRGQSSYQRLEFLGDRVLAIVIAEMLYETYPDAEEGELARRLNALVKRETCADVARHLGFGSALRLGPGEAATGGRTKLAILADVMEAVIAAVYLDGGLDAARTLVRREWEPLMAAPTAPLRDAKTMLQEWLQGQGLPAPRYVLVDRSGPDHDPRFTIAVEMTGKDGASANGRSKREAEQAAATAVLAREGLWRAEGRTHG